MENPLATEACRANGGPWLVTIRAPFIAPWGNFAHHLYPSRTLLPPTSTLRALPYSAPLYCAHPLAHHLHRTRTLSLTTPTLRGSRLIRTPHKTRRPDDRSHGDALSPEPTIPLAAARSPCAHPLAHHPYLARTLLLITSTLRTLSCSPSLPCAHSPAHHLYLARTLLLTTSTLRALPCSPPPPCAHSFDQHLYLARTPLLTTSPLCTLSCPPPLPCAHSLAHHLYPARTPLHTTKH